MEQIKMETRKGSPLSPETMPSFWNPRLLGIRTAPEDFREKYKAISDDLEIVWNRFTERWQCFARSNRVNHPICRGWRLLFIVSEPDGSYRPLDERTLAEIWARDGMRQGDSKKYFDRVQREFFRDKEIRENASKQEDWDGAGDYYKFTQPKVGYGPISQSKVVGQ